MKTALESNSLKEDHRPPAKIFAIGDIHGRHDKLTRLLARLPYVPGQDTLVLLGDYINRGPESPRVLDTILELERQGRVVALLGNHEHLLLEFHRTGDMTLLHLLRKLQVETTVAGYGQDTLSGLQDLSFLPAAHRRFLKRLQPFWETGEYIFVHAGLEPGLPLAAQNLEVLTSSRDLFLANEQGFPKRVVFGHTSFATPFVTPTKIGIDTGVAYGGQLTAVELPSLQFYHA